MNELHNLARTMHLLDIHSHLLDAKSHLADVIHRLPYTAVYIPLLYAIIHHLTNVMVLDEQTWGIRVILGLFARFCTYCDDFAGKLVRVIKVVNPFDTQTKWTALRIHEISCCRGNGDS